MMSSIDRTIFQQDLLNGEEILWVGHPDVNKIFTLVDFYLIPFSLLWGGFAIFLETTALLATVMHGTTGRAPLIFLLFGVPFVLIGLYLIFGRFIFKAWRKRRTYYAVTNKSIIILTTIFGRNLQALQINTLPVISESVNATGYGHCSFRRCCRFHRTVSR